MNVNWIVVFKRDTDNPEVYPFEDREQLVMNWSEVY
jgi:hypothetical protein